MVGTVETRLVVVLVVVTCCHILVGRTLGIIRIGTFFFAEIFFCGTFFFRGAFVAGRFFVRLLFFVTVFKRDVLCGKARLASVLCGASPDSRPVCLL